MLVRWSRNIDLRCVEIDGEPWFVAKEVCEAISIANSRRAVMALNESEKGVHRLNSPGGPQNTSIISESGLYKLVMRSDKREAKDFQHWVTAVVLPAIRENGKRPG